VGRKKKRGCSLPGDRSRWKRKLVKGGKQEMKGKDASFLKKFCFTGKRGTRDVAFRKKNKSKGGAKDSAGRTFFLLSGAGVRARR